MDKDQLLKLARAGAETMVKRRRAEIIAIERTFPELALPHGRRGHGAIETASLRTRTMSAAASKASVAR